MVKPVSHSLSIAQDDFHDRELEQELLKALVGKKPTRILAVVGPVSSGKTRLLNHVLVDAWKESGLGAPAIYIDGREHKLETAADLVKAMVDPGAEWATKLFRGNSMLAELLKRLNASVQFPVGLSQATLAAPSVKNAVDAYLDIIARYKVRTRLGSRIEEVA